MPCLFALVAGMFPRLGTFIIWLARPAMFSLLQPQSDPWLQAGLDRSRDSAAAGKANVSACARCFWRD